MLRRRVIGIGVGRRWWRPVTPIIVPRKERSAWKTIDFGQFWMQFALSLSLPLLPNRILVEQEPDSVRGSFCVLHKLIKLSSKWPFAMSTRMLTLAYSEAGLRRNAFQWDDFTEKRKFAKDCNDRFRSQNLEFGIRVQSSGILEAKCGSKRSENIWKDCGRRLP